jgi:Fe-Mn family superoxide dismutase
MAIELPPLPYPIDALQPHISRETLEFHHGKHHKAYVDKTNELIAGTEFEKAALEDIVRRAQGTLFNQAAQVWNHTFYWQSLSPQGGGEPSGSVKTALDKAFGSVDEFRKAFTAKAAGHFGSGWIWLVKQADGKIAITEGHDAANPLTQNGVVPLLACDVWEHAYYIDYRNAKPKYMEAFWKVVNWSFIEKNLG